MFSYRIKEPIIVSVRDIPNNKIIIMEIKLDIIENIRSKCKIVLVDNIYDYVLKDDEEYAKSLKEKLIDIFGLCYINKNNEMELLVVKDKGNTTIGTAYHESIHAVDYYMLSSYTKEKDIRKLQKDAKFRLWSEFRAEYFTYQYLIKEYGYKEDVYSFMQELTEEMDEFIKKDEIYLCDAVDFSVRIFGKYLAAWETNKKEFPRFPLHLFINRDFGRLCNFLYDHIEFDSIIGNMEELFVAFGRSADQGRRMEERWKGLGGAATFVKDGIDMLKNGIQGYGFAADNCVGSGIALEKAMEDIGNGAIFSEKKMEELQKRFSLTDEDMEMLRQHTLDTNPELRKIADSFSFLGNASAQSLDQITNGLKYVDIGVSSTDEIAARLKRRFGEDLTPTTKNFFDAWFDSSGKLSDNFYELQTGEQVIGGYTDSLKNAQTSMQEFGKEVSNAGQSIANGFESLDSTKISESITTAIGSASESVISIANEVGQKIGGEVGSGISTYDFTQEATSVQGNVSSAMETAFAGNESMQQIGIRAAEGIGEGMGQADVNAPAQTFFGRLLESIKSVFGIASPAKNMMPSGQYITLGILEGFKSKFDAFTAPIQQLCNSITSKIANGLQNMRNTWSNIWNSLPNVVTGVINRITSSLSTLVSNISRAFSSISSGIRSIGSGFSGIGYKTKSQSVTKIKGYAAGGFPEDGWFRASHGEIMGQFDNGQSVAANNNQITDGIEQAAYRGFMRALQSAGTGTSSVNVILEGDAAQFFSYTKEEYNKEASRKGVTSRDPVFA